VCLVRFLRHGFVQHSLAGAKGWLTTRSLVYRPVCMGRCCQPWQRGSSITIPRLSIYLGTVRAWLAPLKGAPVLGLCACALEHGVLCLHFARTGLGEKRDYNTAFSTKFLCQSREENNRKLIKTLKEGSRSGDLLEHCRKDLKAGRMECPRLAHECNLAEITLSPRFGVEQGVLL
jgi:hypothetical protein